MIDLHKRQTVCSVTVPLPGSPGGVRGRVLHAPDLDVPAVRQEVSPPTPIPGQDRLNAMRDAVLAEPVAGAALVRRPDQMAILAGEPLAPIPPVAPDLNAETAQAGDDERAAHPYLGGHLFNAVAALVTTDEFRIGRPLRLLPGSPGLPDRRATDAHLPAPQHDRTRIDAVPSCDATVANVLDVQQTVKFIGRWGLNPAIGETASTGSLRNAVRSEPSADGYAIHAEHRGDLAGRHLLLNVQPTERFVIWSHSLILSVEYGTRPVRKFVEYGTRRMGARPYLRPAAEAVLPRFAERVKAVLRGLR